MIDLSGDDDPLPPPPVPVPLPPPLVSIWDSVLLNPSGGENDELLLFCGFPPSLPILFRTGGSRAFNGPVAGVAGEDITSFGVSWVLLPAAVRPDERVSVWLTGEEGFVEESV